MASRSSKGPKYDIRSEYSAQRMSHPPNPALSWVLSWIHPDGHRVRKLRIADLGCGKLRHFKALSAVATDLILVDTEEQLSRTHRDGDREYTVKHFAKSANRARLGVRAMTSHEFDSSRLKLDAVFCIAAFDVVLRSVRQDFIRASHRNLREDGIFIVIAPRNDSSILRRCSSDNRYMDGHVFHHHGVTTFFTNFKSINTIKGDCEAVGYQLVADLSRYRHACLVFSKSSH